MIISEHQIIQDFEMTIQTKIICDGCKEEINVNIGKVDVLSLCLT